MTAVGVVAPRPWNYGSETMKKLPLLVAAGLILLGGCASGADALSADSEIFAGLDPATVAESLQHPGISSAVQSASTEEARDAAAQYNAAWLTTCRDLYAAYTSWLQTGTQPPLVKATRPSTPVSDNASYLDADDALYASTWAENDPASIRDLLVNPAGCGDWTPATPGDFTGPTIRKALEAAS